LTDRTLARTVAARPKTRGVRPGGASTTEGQGPWRPLGRRRSARPPRSSPPSVFAGPRRSRPSVLSRVNAGDAVDGHILGGRLRPAHRTFEKLLSLAIVFILVIDGSWCWCSSPSPPGGSPGSGCPLSGGALLPGIYGALFSAPSIAAAVARSPGVLDRDLGLSRVCAERPLLGDGVVVAVVLARDPRVKAALDRRVLRWLEPCSTSSTSSPEVDAMGTRCAPGADARPGQAHASVVEGRCRC